MDFSLQATPTANISGRVVNSRGAPASTTVYLAPLQPHPLAPERNWNSSSPKPLFEFRGISPGAYDLFAMVTYATGLEIGLMPITVGSADTSGIALNLSQGVAVQGRVVLGGATSSGNLPESLRQIRVDLRPLDLPPALAASFPAPRAGPVDSEGRFVVQGVFPGRYAVAATTLPQGMEVAGVRIGGIAGNSNSLTVSGPAPDAIEILIQRQTAAQPR
jgi:hypothetical protein